MKKAFIIFILAIVSTVASQAQLRIGVKGGYDVISSKINSDILNSSNRLGYQMGLTLEFLPLGGFGIDASLLYGHKEYKQDDLNTNLNLTNYNYISIPINLKKRIGITDQFGIFGTIGAYADVKIDGNNIEYIEQQYKSKNFQMGVGCGFGVRVFEHFDVGLNYKRQLTENFNSDKPEFEDFKENKQKDWTLSLSYYF